MNPPPDSPPPGSIRSIDHVNIVVEDLDRQLAFYRELLGFSLTRQVTISGDWIENVVGLRDVEADVVYLSLPEGPRLELIRYRSPEAMRPEGLEHPATPGLRHIAFRVDDIAPLVERLERAGVPFFGEVQDVPSGQVTYAGNRRKRLVYFRDPEGTVLEFCEYVEPDSV